MSKTIPMLALMGALACLPLQGALAQNHNATPAATQATMIGADGKPIGTVRLEQTGAGVLITTDLAGLPPGEHAFHIHEKGLCDPADGFKSAGGHYEPGKHMHGFLDPAGPHAGDMPNQFVAADGALHAAVINHVVTLGKGAGPLADADGSALVIHAGADDYASQPAGAAGGRIACAVIAPPAH